MVPVKGYKTMSIPEDVYAELKELADRSYRTVPQLLAYLVDNQKETLEKILHIDE